MVLRPGGCDTPPGPDLRDMEPRNRDNKRKRRTPGLAEGQCGGRHRSGRARTSIEVAAAGDPGVREDRAAEPGRAGRVVPDNGAMVVVTNLAPSWSRVSSA